MSSDFAFSRTRPKANTSSTVSPDLKHSLTIRRFIYSLAIGCYGQGGFIVSHTLLICRRDGKSNKRIAHFEVSITPRKACSHYNQYSRRDLKRGKFHSHDAATALATRTNRDRSTQQFQSTTKVAASTRNIAVVLLNLFPLTCLWTY